MTRPVRVNPFVLAVIALASSACGPAPMYDHEPVTAEAVDPAVVVMVQPEAAPTPAHAPNGIPLGRWIGVGHQSNGSSWSVVALVSSLDAGPCATIELPTSRCGGQWVCREPFDGHTLRAEEELTFGHENCIDHIDVEVTPTPEGFLHVRWQGSGQAAVAMLRYDE